MRKPEQTLGIIGGGAWGSALALALEPNFFKIILYRREPHPPFASLPGICVDYNKHPNIEWVNDLAQCAHQADCLLLAVSSRGFSEAVGRLFSLWKAPKPLAWLTKGFSIQEGALLHEGFLKTPTLGAGCVISGPSFAREVALGLPTALVCASEDSFLREWWANACRTEYLRMYTNPDIIGVEVGGAVKNILAIAAGIAEALGLGQNARASLISRGLYELSALGVALGGQQQTFYGLSGLGDLVLTCSGDASRNFCFGRRFVASLDKNETLTEMGGTIEGLNALPIALSLGQKYAVELPICTMVSSVVEGIITPKNALMTLLSRRQISE